MKPELGSKNAPPPFQSIHQFAMPQGPQTRRWEHEPEKRGGGGGSGGWEAPTNKLINLGKYRDPLSQVPNRYPSQHMPGPAWNFSRNLRVAFFMSTFPDCKRRDCKRRGPSSREELRRPSYLWVSSLSHRLGLACHERFVTSEPQRLDKGLCRSLFVQLSVAR